MPHSPELGVTAGCNRNSLRCNTLRPPGQVRYNQLDVGTVSKLQLTRDGHSLQAELSGHVTGHKSQGIRGTPQLQTGTVVGLTVVGLNSILPGPFSFYGSGA